MSTTLKWATVLASSALLATVVAALTFWHWISFESGARSDSEHVLDLSTQPAEVVANFRYIESHRALAEHIPCYCGCGRALGHQNLFDCFVISPGKYSDHAEGCVICRREAADIERLSADGTDMRAIRTWIDGEYSKYGPPTNTP